MSWDRYEKAAEKGPGHLILACGLTVVGLVCFFGTLGYVLGWFTEAGKVVQDNFGSRAALQRYEEFKDIAANCEAKLASIKVAQKRLTEMEKTYAGTPRKEWPRDERERYATWEQELTGMKASFNLLAADYNARMAKDNYRYANVGELPKGANNPLPREFKAYLEE